MQLPCHDAPLAGAAEALRTGRIEPTAYVETLGERAEAVEPTLRAFVPEEGRRERVRAAAATLAERYPREADRPPLYGVPVGVKDIFHVDGLPTRAGSDLPPESLAGPEAAAVTALREAGAVVLGKTVTAEFAHAEPGPTRNPHATDHTPGGSSSGSAAAVAAGLCPLALGTQTIGSVIRPAAFCGVVGFKPSFGRISTAGVIRHSESVDQVGFFTQDVPGAALAASVLCSEWRDLPSPDASPVLGVPEGPYLSQASETGLEAFESHLSRLEAAGYEVRRVEALADVAEVNERHERLTAADAAIAHHDRFEEYYELYAARTRELVERGREVSAEEIAVGRTGRTSLRAGLEAAMADRGIDAWIAPAAPGPAPASLDTTGDPVMNLPWTHAGLPTVALPAGRTDAGLPLGVQCAAAFGADERLLQWAVDIRAALDATSGQTT